MTGYDYALRTWTKLMPIVMAAWILTGIFSNPSATGANDASRWDTVWSLTTGHGYVIDGAPFPTVDKVCRRGQYFSSKPPLLATVVAGLVFLVHETTPFRFPRDRDAVVWFVLIAVNVIPAVIMASLYSKLLESSGFNQKTIAICTFIACFATFLTAYSTTLNNHTVAACSVFFSLFCLAKIMYSGTSDWGYFTLCGVFCAWAAVNELVASAYLAIVAVLLFRIDRRRVVIHFSPPVAVILGAHFFTTYLATGGFTPNYFHFGSEIYHYQGSYWNNPSGIDAAAENKLVYGVNMLFGHHGIFSLSPVLFVGACGFFIRTRFEAINRVGVVLSIYTFMIYAFTTNNYGGVCQGLRWFLWLVPFFLFSLPAAIEKNLGSMRCNAIVLASIAISVGSVVYALVNGGPWSCSWLHLLMRRAGWVSY